MALNTTIPVVLLGRYTTIAGEGDFTSVPISVAGYSKIELTVWRGEFADAGYGYRLALEESMDQDTWEELAVITPTSAGETPITEDLSRSWLRVIVNLAQSGSDFPVIATYAVGLLIARLGRP